MIRNTCSAKSPARVFNVSDKSSTDLESRLLQIETEERKTELDFWRDTAELRKDLFEAKKEYSAVSNRELLFDSLEDNYGGSFQ